MTSFLFRSNSKIGANAILPNKGQNLDLDLFFLSLLKIIADLMHKKSSGGLLPIIQCREF
jgi:hypothetical protein